LTVLEYEAREEEAARQHLIEHVKNLRGALQTYWRKVSIEGDESELGIGPDEWCSAPSDEPDDN
jgi:hypothetical protein